MKRRFAITAVVLLCTAIFVGVVCAGSNPVTKPLKAMWTGTLYVLGPCTDPLFPVGAFQTINIGKGVSTLTGESDFIFGYCTFFDSATSMAGSGWGIVTSAKGDAMYLSVEVTVDLGKTPPEWSETEFIVGGTGRFEGATGSSDSGGTWTVGSNPFPFGSSPPIPPLLLQAPQPWVGTSEGEVTF
jgi:hypothetical protein